MRYIALISTLLLSLVLTYSYGTESTPVYTLTTSVVGEGSITPSSGEYEEGETVTPTGTPSEHYLFSNWSGDGSGYLTRANYNKRTDKTLRECEQIWN
ncbi:MAG: hypothetical protein WD607_00310 [Candidatus Paceibacterota bacterium]